VFKAGFNREGKEAAAGKSFKRLCQERRLAQPHAVLVSALADRSVDPFHFDTGMGALK